MIAELTSALGLIITGVKEIANATTRIRATPKQRFLRQIVALFDIFESVEEQIAEINSNLQAFIREEQIGMRVHYIHKAGVHFQEFIEVQNDFFRWGKKSEHIARTLGLFSEETISALDRLVGAHSRARETVADAIETVRNELQAVRSPNPAKFVSSETVVDVITQLENLNIEIKKARKTIREFVCANFSIEDLLD